MFPVLLQRAFLLSKNRKLKRASCNQQILLYNCLPHYTSNIQKSPQMKWLIKVSQSSFQFLNDLTRVCSRDICSSNHFLHKVVWKHSYLSIQFSLAPSIIHICYILDDVSSFQTELVVLLCDVVKSDASCSTQKKGLELADVEKFRQLLRKER